MDNPRVLYKISENAKLVFLFSAAIFVLSVIPASYGIGYSNGLSGAAGLSGNPETIPPVSTISIINGIVAAVSGVTSSSALAISALAAARKSKIESEAAMQKSKIEREIEEMKLETARIQHEMQTKEIEKLHLELEVEKREKKKKA